MRKVLYIFGLLTDADIDWMARVGVRRRIRDGEVLIREGETVDTVLLRLEGEFTVNAAEIGEVARLGAGEVVGEMSFVDSAPPSATVSARGDCFVLFLDKHVLAEKLRSDLAFGCRFYRALAIFLADRLRGTVRRATQGLAAPAILKDELDREILDNLSLARNRFDRMLKVLAGQL